MNVVREIAGPFRGFLRSAPLREQSQDQTDFVASFRGLAMLAKARYREASLQSFRTVLSAWLATIPPAGWEGSAAELEDALETLNAERRLRGLIPRGAGLGGRMRNEVPFLKAKGFTLEFRRTAVSRTLRVDHTTR